MKHELAKRIRNFARYIQDKGFLASLRLVRHELWQDYYYGIDTSPVCPGLPPEGAEIPASFRIHNTGYIYQGSSTRVFNAIIYKIPEDIRGETFVDIGSGKGRTLILASLKGFSNLVGVELKSSLCAQARQNVEKFSKRRNLDSKSFEILEMNVLDFDIPPHARFFYFFNPFGKDILEKVVERILESSRIHPRNAPIFCMYEFPVHPEVFESRNPKEKTEVLPSKHSPAAVIYQY